MSTTGGPVQLDVIVKGPIRYWEGENKVRFPININIQNTGGGTTCTTSEIQVPIVAPFSFNFMTIVVGCENPDFWNKVIFYFEPSDPSTQLYCGSDTIKNNVVELWKGQSATLTCEVEMSVPPQRVGLIHKNLKFSIYYAYFVDRTTNVEVIGRETAI